MTHRLVFTFTIAIAWLVNALPAGAQSPPNLDQRPRMQQVSDALILISPQGDRAMMSITYPKVVPHAGAQDRLRRLGQAGGWAVQPLEIKDEDVTTSPGFGNTKSLGKQTGVVASLAGAPLARDNAFLLQPFVDAFSDLKQIEILYLFPPDPMFQGLVDYSVGGIAVKLLKGGSPYRYVITMRGGVGAPPLLPLKQPRPPAVAAHKAPRAEPSLALVVVFAAGAGLAVLVVLLMYQRVRSAQAARPRPRRTSR